MPKIVVRAVKLLIKNKNYRTIWSKGKDVFMIDQRKLPHSFKIVKCKDFRQTSAAIKNMTIRGAPAIGAAGAFALMQAALVFKGKDFESFGKELEKAERHIASTRPTARDLFHALKMMKVSVMKAKSVIDAKHIAVNTAKAYSEEQIGMCKKIGDYGNKLIKNNYKILTHCNAGALATVDIGTALAPIRAAHKAGKNVFVFVDETRPWLQGARLTAWELANEGIRHVIIADNAAGFFMQKGDVDIVIVGADRVAANGDVANKIGTYEKAVVAYENKIPFYVAAPLSTFDLNCKSGKDIEIEIRHEDEVHSFGGKRVSSRESRALNPVFDVTPAKFITGIITEKGIVKAKKEDILGLFAKTL